MEFIPNSVAGWVTTSGALMLALIFLFSTYSKGMVKKREDADSADDRLINLLKGTVEELERKVNGLEETNKKFTLDLAHLKTENEVMTKVLQGRDQATVEFQQKGYDAMNKLDVVLKQTTEMSVHVEKLYKLMERHLKIIETKV